MNETGNIALGIDIGGTGIKGALVDLDTGALVSERFRLDTPHPALPGAVADTVVAVGRRILPKTETLEEAQNCLKILSGRRHKVYGGICLIAPRSGSTRRQSQRLSVSEVLFKRLSPAEITLYLASKEWHGKAGGYAVQGLAAAFIKRLAGSYSNIVGLSLYDTAALLSGLGCTASSLRSSK